MPTVLLVAGIGLLAWHGHTLSVSFGFLMLVAAGIGLYARKR